MAGRGKRILDLVLGIARATVPGVAQVEEAAKVIGTLKGAAKQAAVVDLIQKSIATAEGVADKDLINDLGVIEATKALIDAEVAVMNAKDKLAAVIDEIKARRADK